MPNLTSAQQAQAQAMGLDVSKVDWSKWLTILQTLLGLLNQPHPAMAKAAGCEDGDLGECTACMHAGQKALESAAISFGHCDACCKD